MWLKVIAVLLLDVDPVSQTLVELHLLVESPAGQHVLQHLPQAVALQVENWLRGKLETGWRENWRRDVAKQVESKFWIYLRAIWKQVQEQIGNFIITYKFLSYKCFISIFSIFNIWKCKFFSIFMSMIKN